MTRDIAGPLRETISGRSYNLASVAVNPVAMDHEHEVTWHDQLTIQKSGSHVIIRISGCQIGRDVKQLHSWSGGEHLGADVWS